MFINSHIIQYDVKKAIFEGFFTFFPKNCLEKDEV